MNETDSFSGGISVIRPLRSKSPDRSELTRLFWNTLTLTSCVVALFFLLTNGVPLVQGEILPPFGKKIRYIRTMEISVSIFFLLGMGLFWKARPIFDRLWVIAWMRKVERMPREILLILLFAAYSSASTAVGFMRHVALESRAFDLGIFAQAVWNTLQGEWLYSSLKGGICLLGDHVEAILFLIAPFYALWPDPRVLILLQAIAAGLSIFPIGYLAKEKIQNRWLELAFVLAYCFYLPTRNALREDFHPEVLVDVLWLAAFIFLERRRFFLFLLAVLIAVSAKENMFGIAFMLGFYATVWQKERKLGIALMVVSVAVFAWEILWLVPQLSQGLYFYRGVYSHLLQSPFSGLATSLLNPEAGEYFVKIFSPFIFLPFFHLPTLSLTFPVLFQNMISRNPATRSLAYHYTSGLTPFLFIAAIYGFCRLRERFPWIAKRQGFCAAIFLFVALLRSGPSEYYYFSEIVSHRSAHRDFVREELKKIPKEASVFTHNNLIAQIANRREVYQFNYNPHPNKVEMARDLKTDYVIFELEFWEPGAEPLEQALEGLKGLGYGVQLERDGFYILSKKETQL